jgi:hypothetical protein
MLVSYISWNPPKLTEEEELELGRQIAIQGRAHWSKEFRKSLGKSLKEHTKKNPNPYESMDYTKNWNPIVRKIFNVALAIMILAGLCLMSENDWEDFGVRMLTLLVPAVIIVTAILLFSYRHATQKFDSWVDYLVAKYAAHVAKGGYPQDYRN